MGLSAQHLGMMLAPQDLGDGTSHRIRQGEP